MVDIRLVNEDGKIVGKNPNTGETIPINLDSVDIDSERVELAGSGEPTELAGDAATYWSNIPQARRVVEDDIDGTLDYDRTFFGFFETETSNVVAGQYDHDTGEITTTVIDTDLRDDDHITPSIEVLADGRLLYIWDTHNSVGEMIYTHSTDPLDISSMDDRTLFDTGNAGISYSSPVRMPDGTIYCFYRYKGSSGGGDMGYAYVTSDDGGETWSDETRFLHNDSGDYLYNHIDHTRGETRVEMVINRRDQRVPHPSQSLYNIYHCYFDGATETIHAADGTEIADTSATDSPISDVPMVRDTESNNRQAWGYAANVNDGNPEIVWDEFGEEEPERGDLGTQEHETWYGKYLGDSEGWTITKITESGAPPGLKAGWGYSNGMDLDKVEEGVVYLSVGSHKSSKIQRWETDDDGETWSYTDWTDPWRQNFRPIVPKNRHPDMPVIWQHGDFTDWRNPLKGIDCRLLTGRRQSNKPKIGNPVDVLRARVSSNRDIDSTTFAIGDSWDGVYQLSYGNIVDMGSWSLDTWDGTHTTQHGGWHEFEVTVNFGEAAADGRVEVALVNEDRGVLQVKRHDFTTGDAPSISISDRWILNKDSNSTVHLRQNSGDPLPLRGGVNNESTLSVTRYD